LASFWKPGNKQIGYKRRDMYAVFADHISFPCRLYWFFCVRMIIHAHHQVENCLLVGVCVCVYKIMFRHKHPILHFQQALNTLKSRGFSSTLMSSKWLVKQILQKWLGTLLYTWAHLSLTLLLRDGQKTKRGGRKAMIKKGV